MSSTRRRKCRHCGQLYDPDSRNRYHQRYCGRPACRQASKAASQRRWRASPKGRDYFRGSANRLRVQAWRRAHPGYWRRQRKKSRPLQDHCLAQTLVPSGDKTTLTRSALQDLIHAQGLALTGLVAQLTGSALQENIALSTRRLILLGRQIQGPACPAGRSRRSSDGLHQTCSVPRATTAGALPVQLGRPTPGPG